ncbi:uncharacterized protein BP5553_07537 [Venustampulla echinocandica]|uniref:Uncharacterized protein n=1 Tax=Venustampulla echinocandica TaxID=2656787 RepID=A0A370TGT0_9HELO|nr:uncharacterized protein BP5553_07537 [Venustampulla echinocandica]RDL34409.1 hypothetical protein BP5553_07537 [Venustampulla echinocandica]
MPERSERSAEVAAEQLALDIAAKAFCRVAIPTLLAPLELIEDLIPFVSWILDAVEIAATPKLIQLCVKGIEKEGKLSSKSSERKSLCPWQLRRSPSLRGRRLLATARYLQALLTANERIETTIAADHSVTVPPSTRVPRRQLSSQPRMFQPAVVEIGHSRSRGNPNRPWRNQWYNDHNAEWFNSFMQQRAGNLPVYRSDERYVSDRVVGGLKRRVTHYYARTTCSVVRIDFGHNVVDPDGVMGLQNNPCWPEVPLEDPGFALLTDDPYYAGYQDAQRYGKANYPGLIPADVLGNNVAQAGFRKRNEDSHDLDPDAWIVDEGNTTRRVTDAELQEELGIDTAVAAQPKETGYPKVVPTAIASTTHLTVEVVATPVAGASAVSGASAQGILMQPQATGMNALTDCV